MAIDRKLLFLPLLLAMGAASTLPRLSAVGEDAVSLIPPFAMALGLWHWLATVRGEAGRFDMAVALAISLAFTLPGYQWGLLLLALTASYLYFSDQTRPHGALIVAMAAALEPLLTFSLKWLSGPLLTFDAMLTAALLRIGTGSGSHFANLVMGPGEHQLLILKGCSSLNNLGGAWLAWFTVVRIRCTRFGARSWLILTALSLATLALNLGRLYGMALDMEWHAWWHSPMGSGVYQAVLAMLLLTAVILGARHERT